MNQIDFTQTGGFPLDQNVFGLMQQNIFLASQTATLAGNLAIISGCVVASNTVSNGYVVINGEILPFVGTTIDTKVVIYETRNNLNYEDGVARPSEIIRYATFGDDGVTNYLWANFKRNTAEGVLARLERLERIAAPILTGNGWLLFNRPANEIPAQWAEVVEMRGRTAIHQNVNDARFDIIGETGGSITHVINRGNLPEVQINSGLYHYSNDYFDGGAAPNNIGVNPNSTPVKTEYLGAGQEINHMNPYRIVLYIKYVGV